MTDDDVVTFMEPGDGGAEYIFELWIWGFEVYILLHTHCSDGFETAVDIVERESETLLVFRRFLSTLGPSLVFHSCSNLSFSFPLCEIRAVAVNVAEALYGKLFPPPFCAFPARIAE